MHEDREVEDGSEEEREAGDGAALQGDEAEEKEDLAREVNERRGGRREDGCSDLELTNTAAVLLRQHGAELGELVGAILKRPEDRFAIFDREASGSESASSARRSRATSPRPSRMSPLEPILAYERYVGGCMRSASARPRHQVLTKPWSCSNHSVADSEL